MNNNQDRKKAFVIINSEQKGFFTAISKVLSNNYNYDVTIVCRDIYVKKIVDKLLPNFVNNGTIMINYKYVEDYF